MAWTRTHEVNAPEEEHSWEGPLTTQNKNRHMFEGGYFCEGCGQTRTGWKPGDPLYKDQAPEYKQCEHGYHHPSWAHACDGCMH